LTVVGGSMAIFDLRAVHVLEAAPEDVFPLPRK
jgi:hypothetical protein